MEMAKAICSCEIRPLRTASDRAVETARGRTAAIVADAAHAILVRPSRSCSGNFFIDEDVLRAEGVSSFEQYAVEKGQELLPDFFLD